MKRSVWFPVYFITFMFCGLLYVNAEEKPIKSSSTVESKAYAGHDHDKDKDMTELIKVHPELSGTVLDDCRLCHTDGIWENKYVNHCDYCHVSRESKGYTPTLNSYGRDYAAAGRSANAISAIEAEDSDGDGFINSAEIAVLSFPGEAGSRPDLKDAPSIVLNSESLAKIKRHSQFLLLNAHRVSDVYATYSGWQLYDLLASVNGLNEMTAITVISSDGFRKDYTRKDILMPFTRCVFYGSMDTKAFLGDCPAWVKYPEVLPPGVETGKEIPGEQRLILADRKNGNPLEILHRTPEGKLAGEGPFRAVYPQRRNAPPDQSKSTGSKDCPNPFNEKTHHNSSDSARGVIAIMVHPLPEGTKEPDWQSISDELLQSGSIMIFGAIKVETPGKIIHK